MKLYFLSYYVYGYEKDVMYKLVYADSYEEAVEKLKKQPMYSLTVGDYGVHITDETVN